MTVKPKIHSRRTFLVTATGVVGATIAAVYPFRTRIVDLILTNVITNETLPAEGVSFLDSDACILTPQTSEGPYYVDEDYMAGSLVRSDLRDGKPGVDLRLTFKIVDAETCSALAGVAVDIWSCDAVGYYSGHANASPDEIPFSTLFKGHVDPTTPDRAMRGRQIANSDGIVEFLTIFPGWYKPRTVHIHLMVIDSKNKIMITQIFFPQAIINEIHATAPYNTHGSSIYTNEKDPLIAIEGPGAGWPKMVKEGDRYSGTLTIGVRRA